MGTLDQAEPIEKAGIDELRALQLARLRWSLRHAYDNVPHYRGAFDAIDAHPDDLAELDHLSKFPFTTKSELRANYPFGMFAAPMQDIVRVHASSGTTGKPTVVGYTKQDIETWATVMARSLRAAGGRSTDIVHVAYGYGLFTGGLGAHYGAEMLGATVIPVSGGMTERQVQLIRDFKPGIIMATPSYLLVIADEFVRQGLDPAETSLRVGIFGAEPWSESMRTELEKRFGIAALDLYGLSEVIGPGVAAECIDTRDGLTIWEDPVPRPKFEAAPKLAPLRVLSAFGDDARKGEVAGGFVGKDDPPGRRARNHGRLAPEVLSDLAAEFPGQVRPLKDAEFLHVGVAMPSAGVLEVPAEHRPAGLQLFFELDGHDYRAYRRDRRWSTGRRCAPRPLSAW